MDIKLIVVGKMKDYFQKASEDYQKRIKPFANLKIIEIKETNTDDINKNLNTEAKDIINNINTNDYVITLEIDGKAIDSIAFSHFIFDHYLYNDRVITFIIGGSNGIGQEVLNRSNYAISFGKITYPHQLMRVILLEQIYRAIMINNNSKYHK